MAFKTKLDFSNNRQIKQHPETLTTLSGGTSFGLTFEELTKGPDLSTSGETETYSLISSTFSGNNTTTIYNWYDSRMSIGETFLSALTPSNSAETQTVLPIFQPSASVVIDGNVVNTAFTGVTFDITGLIMLDLGGGNYSGSVETENFSVLSANTAEYTGRTIWVDSSGITRTERLIITNNPQVGYVLTCNDTEGMSSWAPLSGGSGSVSYWSAGTGTDSIATVNTLNLASGDYSVAEGYSTIASGDYSHSEGLATTASGQASHAEGRFSIAGGQYSHAEGYATTAIGISSHAQGYTTQANGQYSHAGGFNSVGNGFASFVHGSNSVANGDYSIVLGRNITGDTADTTYVDSLNIKTLSVGVSINNLGIDSNGKVVVGSTGSSGSTSYWSAGTGTNAITTLNSNNIASGNFSLAEGFQTQANGNFSHAEGLNTQAFGRFSHAEGNGTQADGDYSHAEGGFTQANGNISHAEGDNTIASGEASHAEGVNSLSSGYASHAEGRFTVASGFASHAGGNFTKANGDYSFIHGENSVVNGDFSIVLGRNITGDTANTTYVDNLNIKTVSLGPGVIDIGVDVNGNVVNQASDIRLKENIVTIENPLDKVMKLRGVTYNWLDRINGGDDLRLGFIAQEVKEVIPELVTNNGEYLGVQYKDIPALLVEAIKELVSGNTKYSKTYLETQTILAEDNNIELNYNGTVETSIGGGITIIRGDEESSNFSLDENGNWISNVNIFSKGFIIPEYTPTSSKDTNGIFGNIVQDDDYIYIKRKGGWKRTPKLEDF